MQTSGQHLGLFIVRVAIQTMHEVTARQFGEGWCKRLLPEIVRRQPKVGLRIHWLVDGSDRLHQSKTSPLAFSARVFCGRQGKSIAVLKVLWIERNQLVEVDQLFVLKQVVIVFKLRLQTIWIGVPGFFLLNRRIVSNILYNW